MRISATDTAGITGSADTDPVRIVKESHSLAPVYVAVIVAGTVAVSCGLAAILTVLITRRRCVPGFLYADWHLCDVSDDLECVLANQHGWSTVEASHHSSSA